MSATNRSRMPLYSESTSTEFPPRIGSSPRRWARRTAGSISGVLGRMEHVGWASRRSAMGRASSSKPGRAFQPPVGEARPAEGEVDGEPHDGLEEDQQEPALRRLRRALEGDDDDRGEADRPFDRNEERPPETGVGDPVLDHFPALATPEKMSARIGASMGPVPKRASSAAVTRSATCSRGIVPRSWMKLAIGVPVTSPVA